MTIRTFLPIFLQATQLTLCHRLSTSQIEAMEEMQMQVRRRAKAIDTAFDTCVQRLSSSFVDAVARRSASLANAGVS